MTHLPHAVVNTVIDIRRRLGSGLLESVYRKVLAYELRKRAFDALEALPTPALWDDVTLVD
ncbi:MAG: GxxExxY protein [Planctomycetes bacterium]|nr:GxxExxY protein [Planctomycetota bacterium]